MNPHAPFLASDLEELDARRVSEHGVYRVTGGRNYRGHPPGSTFEARLDRNAERRAVARGDIRLLKRITPSIQPGTFVFPHGWLNQQST